MALRIITPPAEEPVTLEEVKSHCEITFDDKDDLLNALITTARELVENQTHRAFVEREVEWLLDRFPCHEFQFPVTPVIAVTSIKYDDDDGTEQTVLEADYAVDLISEPARIWPGVDFVWPSSYQQPNAVRVVFTAGYASGDSGGSPVDLAANVPEIAKLAIKMLVAHWFENREAVLVGDQAQEVPFAVKVLMGQLQVYQ
jgi:uncharacterized phiE125 gp8 family phage protein